jgi:hypothetical protein
MPSVLIEVRKAYSEEQETALIEAVFAAFREAWKTIPGEKNVRLLVYPPHRFAVSPDLEKPELYTMISIDALVGRSLDAKANLYRAILGNLETLGIPKDHVRIRLREFTKENSGLRG